MILRTLAANAACWEHPERFRPPPELARHGDDLFRELFERKIEEYEDGKQLGIWDSPGKADA